MSRTTRTHSSRGAALALVLGLTAAACGTDSEPASTSAAESVETSLETDATEPAADEPEAEEPEAEVPETDAAQPPPEDSTEGAGGAATADCPAGVATESVSGATPEVVDITIAALPLVDFAPLFYAERCGFFEAEGLNAQIEIVQGGPVAVQLLTAGDVQFSFNNWLSVTAIVANGAPLQVVANGTWLADGQGGIFVAEDSPITTPEDLIGTTLAVNTTGNVGDITAASRLAELGIEGQPNWVPTAFPEIIPAIESGAVDGGMLTEPFTTQARAMGLREVLDLYTGATQNLPIAGYVSVAPFVAANPETAAAFRAAIQQATAVLSADEASLRRFIPMYTQVPETAAQALILPIYQTELRLSDLQTPADLMAELGFLDEPLDMTPFVWEPVS